MDVKELVQRARCPALGSATRPARPEPFVIPGVSAGLEGGQAPLVMVDAPAAVGKSTFANWLSNETNAHFIDLAVLNVGSHGFVGNLAAKGLQQPFDRGELTVVIDSLDEGLIRSGFANYEAFFTDVAEVLNSARASWGPGIVRLLLLGRSDSVDLTGLILEAGGAEFVTLQLEYMDEAQATELILAYAKASPGVFHEEPARRAVDAFFHATARALEVNYHKLWSTPVGRGFAGYPPVLRAVAEVISSNPQSALSAWEQPTKWRSAWHLLADTARRLLLREHGIVKKLVPAMPDGAYGPDHQLRLLGFRLTGRSKDYCEDLVFRSPNDEQAFRAAVDSQLPVHPFLADGASEVFGSMVAAFAIDRGDSMRGAEKRVGEYSRWPFMWRFFVENVHSSEKPVIDGPSVGWLLASLWAGAEGSAFASISATDSDQVTLRVTGSSGRDVDVRIAGGVTLRGLARRLEVELPDGSLRLASREDGAGSAVFVMQDVCGIRVGELIVEAHEILVESGSVVTLEVGRCDSAVQSVTRRPQASLRVSPGIFRYPWSAVADVLPEPKASDALAGALEKFLSEIGQVLPDGGRPAFLDGSGRPLIDDVNFSSWSKSGREALGALVRQLLVAGIVTKTAQPAHGPVPMFSYRPDGFRWEDLGGGVTSPDSPPWSTVDWSRVVRFL